jgi:hypothetical protein
MMTTRNATHEHYFVHLGEVFIGHLAAVAGGFLLMVVGLGMGVTMVMLPVGIVVGIAGVLLFVWGLFGHLMSDKTK